MLDTGADVTVLTEETFNNITSPGISPTKVLKGADGRNLNVVCETALELTSKQGASTRTSAFVIKGAINNLLGKREISDLNIINVVGNIHSDNIISRFPALFDGLGTVGEEFDIKLTPGGSAYKLSVPRRIPLGLREKVREELVRMETLGVISSIEEDTDWCAGIVVAPKKNGKIRLCVDLSRLNKSVRREVFPLPHVEDALASLASAKFFSKMDANSGFWQIKLNSKSRELTTFITPFGRYCFNRMPFGISSAPEYFQRQMCKIVKGIEGVLCHMDDILVYGATEEQHDIRLQQTLEAIKQSGLTLNKEKCQFKVKAVEFLGHLVTDKGISAAEDKVKAIIEMDAPKNAKELKRLLGMADYMRKFNPEMAEVEAPMRKLLKKKNEWCWNHEQEQAFKDLKTVLTTFPTLVKFDLDRQHRVTADASKSALGAALLQKEGEGWFPVSYASRTLSETEQRYAQIEKEALAVTWACQKFDFYLVGRRFEVETDHKPLIPLLGEKDLSDLPLRVQRFKLRLMRYDYDIFFSPGAVMHIADSLSRASYPDFRDREREDKTEGHVRCMKVATSMVDESLKEVKQETLKDSVLKEITKYAQDFWPEKNAVSAGAQKYYQFKDELYVQDGIVLRGHRVVIPFVLREKILSRIHEGHQGIVKCSRRAREAVWWPGASRDIQNLVENCEVCLKERAIQHQPLQTSALPDKPWQELGTDLFEFKDKVYLLIVDYYSRWIEIYQLKEMTSKSVIVKMKNAFARFGIPLRLRSDNGG